MKAKSLKKPSDEEKIRLKKSKSAKRKRSYSSDSSDSGRKKPRKSKKLKKKPRKRPRQVSISSTSSSYSSDYSVSSCSTCEKRKESNGKSKVRKGRVSTGTKYKGRERGRSRKRSRSCSTCSDRSGSPSRSKRHRNGREKEERARMRRDDSDIVSSSKDEESKIQRGQKESEPIAEVSDKVVPEKASEKVPDKVSENVVPEKVQNDDTKKTGVVVDAEMILRQKALENFIKFHKVKKCGISEERGVPVSNESNDEVGSVPGTVDIDKEREESILDEPGKVITDMELNGKEEIVPVSVKRPKLRSVIVIPTEREGTDDNTTIDMYNTGEVSNGTKDELNKGSEPNPNPNPSSSVVSGLRKDAGAVQQHEITSGGVDTGGAQYKKKTFSRMHDGETVEVSYNVYIPKKAPALARRKLQRGETSTS